MFVNYMAVYFSFHSLSINEQGVVIDVLINVQVIEKENLVVSFRL